MDLCKIARADDLLSARTKLYKLNYAKLYRKIIFYRPAAVGRLRVFDEQLLSMIKYNSVRLRLCVSLIQVVT